jgi:16S rRNA (guanine527-N7)-methyltransferase
VAVDSIAKKIRVVEGVKEGADIKNLRAVNCRAEQLGEKFDYVVSRAVTEMAKFMPWAWPLLRRGECGTLPNGILYLKGGDLAEELAATRRRWNLYDISTWFEEDFFDTKRVVYTPKD